MNNKQQATSDRKGGFVIMVGLFLFILLTVFALTMAQMIVVDSKVITQGAGGGVTWHQMGPRKEVERLQALYLAQAGIHHMYKKLVEVQRCLSNADPNCSALYTVTNNYDDATPSNQTGAYVSRIVNAGAGFSGCGAPPNPPAHPNTILCDLINVSQVRIPNLTNLSTTLQLQQQFWRSTRAYAGGVTAAVGSFPVNFIDMSDSDPGPGIDQNMLSRDGASGVDPPSSMPAPMSLGNSFIITSCTGASFTQCSAILDFGMEVDFDEIRFLQTSDNYISRAEVNIWDATTGNWVDLPNSTDFPDINNDTDLTIIPYYKPPCGVPHARDQIFNGDRCSNFLGAGGFPTWLNIPTGSYECTVTAGQCTSGGSPVAIQYRSYIGRIKLTAPQRTRRIQLLFSGQSQDGTGTLVLRELGVYCCGNYGTTYPPPPTIMPVLKDLHGVIRIGVAYQYDTILFPGVAVIVYPNPNSATILHEGDLYRGSGAFPQYE